MSAESGLREGVAYSIPHLPTSVFMALVVWAFIAVVSLIVARKAKLAPGKIQTTLEMLITYVCGLADEMIGPEAARFYPLLVALFIFILVANVVGLIPFFQSPTSDPSLTFGLAIMVFIYFNYCGLKAQGWGYFKQFLGPKLPWPLLPIKLLIIITEIISFFIRPFSLGLRLFANIFSKELFLVILASLVVQFVVDKSAFIKILTIAPLVLRPIILLLGLVVAFIQALVFVILTISYIAGALQAQEHQ